jgi:hypothetical protein
MKNEIEESEMMKACEYFVVEENHNIEQKNEEENLNEQYIRRSTDFDNTSKQEK